MRVSKYESWDRRESWELESWELRLGREENVDNLRVGTWERRDSWERRHTCSCGVVKGEEMDAIYRHFGVEMDLSVNIFLEFH